ncbi:hypothetical protein Tsubulata_038565 [Turnera subulata]|uniref:CUE domain-containing protein n=1 Tax=Turnera subulata TaxID=218843 RepID=A0A9Q0F7X5_9ROSI|nr:hypothetical protein Tsubulata_038565 [Turnera subulata]
MAARFLAFSASSTVLSFVALQVWSDLPLDKLRLQALILQLFTSFDNVSPARELLSTSYTTTALLANFVFNLFVLLNLCLKTIFFGELYPSEARRLVERLINYVIYKMFQAMARDRLERLNASPSAMPWIIAFETMQALLVHGFQLLEIWLHHSAWDRGDCQTLKCFDQLTAGSLLEWKGVLIRNLGFSLDMATLLMALGHYALLSAIIKRIKGFVKLRMALGSLHAALPDATSEELQAFDDECAICRGLNEMYSCPTCRKPLFVGRLENEESHRLREAVGDEQLANQINEGLDRQNTPSTLPAGVFPNPDIVEGSSWRGAGLDSSWLHNWPSPGMDGAGPSTTMRSVGLGRVQMMMRHLASVGETYAQTALEDAAWSLWPMNPSQAASASSIPPAGGRFTVGAGGLHIRTPSRFSNDNTANILAMAETVREVLPHVPEELILQDLQRTNSVTVTVNNLLQM